MTTKTYTLYNNQTLIFQKKPCHIRERKDPQKLKRLPKFYLRFSGKNKGKDTRYISSLYPVRNRPEMAFEYQGNHYILIIENMTVQDDLQGFYRESKRDFCRN